MAKGGVVEVSEKRIVGRRSSISHQCEICIKRERYKIIDISSGEPPPNPARVLLTESPLCVMVTENHFNGTKMLLWRCLDPMCLLKNTKEALGMYWMQEMHRRYVQETSQQVVKQVAASKNKRKRKRKKRA